jgi:hypothetical protein
MRGTLFGILAVFAVGCSGTSVISSTDQAERMAPHPNPCIAGMCDPGVNRPWTELDPAAIANDYGRPDLTALIAERIRAWDTQDPIKLAAHVEKLYADLDQLAQH